MIRKLAIIVIVGIGFVFSLAVNTSCITKDDRSELEKQAEFNMNFEPGMSRGEVEQKLNEMQVTEFIKESKANNGDFLIMYRTSYADWGATAYIFRFTSEGELVVFFPLSLSE